MYSKLLLFISLLFATTTLHHISATNHPSPTQPPTIPPPQSTVIQQQQLKDILDALMGSGDFTSWLNTLFNQTNSSSPLYLIPTTSIIPTSATIFVPRNTTLTATATGSLNFDPLTIMTIIPYHILPQRFTFSELQLFQTHTQIPTLLPFKTIVITNNEIGNFTIDDSLITSPDFYTNDVVCVHGVERIFDYVVYGDAGDKIPSSFVTPPPQKLLPLAEDGGTQVSEAVSSISGAAEGDFLLHFVVILFCETTVLLKFHLSPQGVVDFLASKEMFFA
ncbi:FAS1 domain-containing protein SELMODRAFT_448915-like [Rutidosis leptorrhynchoides]|uniref:FAS1 domain-containing protein SELMODRAFT_448915-like n=1 Tax=Rutidosis leptorrhynchoides TaxID=125765 RepID=UPI003A9912B9